jgi:glycosyltransferase involved in cell wall biosynthesis
MIADRQSGLLVPPRDPAALAAALALMLSDPDLRRRCAAAAFERVRGMTWGQTARRTIEVYEKALAARSNGH